MSDTAFYTKNVPPIERVVRILAALAIVAFALLRLPSPVSFIVAAGSVGFALTGFFGYCPACAMVGRRL